MASVPRETLELVSKPAEIEEDPKLCELSELHARLENVLVCLRAAMLAAEPPNRSDHRGRS